MCGGGEGGGEVEGGWKMQGEGPGDWRVKAEGGAMAGGEEVEEGVRGKSRSRLKNALGNDRMCHLSCSGRMSGECGIHSNINMHSLLV